MKKSQLSLLLSTLLFIVNCAEFPAKYSNIIEDEKIRPLAVILEPAEAAPGDTVHVQLKLYDANRSDLDITWKVALDYSVNNYDDQAQEREVHDLDSMALPGGDPSDFRFVVPKGKNNPLLLNRMIPENIPGLGSKKQLVEMLDANPDTTLSSESATAMDLLASIIVLRATIRSDIDLDITKRLTVRYSNKVDENGTLSVNENPHFERFGIITTDDKDAAWHSDKKEILKSEVQWFDNDTTTVDTFTVDDDHAYFLIADTSGAAQQYRSQPTDRYPQGSIRTEELFYSWFYTNLDETGSEWDEQIEIGDGSGDTYFCVKLTVPSDKEMHNFKIRAVVRDYRPEWGVLASQGIAFREDNGYFNFR